MKKCKECEHRGKICDGLTKQEEKEIMKGD